MSDNKLSQPHLCHLLSRPTAALTIRALTIIQSIVNSWSPKAASSVFIGMMGGATQFFAEVLVLKGVGTCDMGTATRVEVMELVGGVGITMHK